MNNYKKLFNNVLIFSLGNLGSKVITLILVPIYTYYLSQAEYGTVDLVTVTVSMLVPIVSASMSEAVLRYVMDEDYLNGDVLYNALGLSLFGYLILVLVYPILNYFGVLDDQLIYLYILLLIQILNQISSQYIRGIGLVKQFAINGMLTTFITGILNILFLVEFSWGVAGYFSAMTISYVISTFYLLFYINPFKSLKSVAFNKKLLQQMLTYSIPLIPNSLMWWAVNSSSRFIISAFIGTSANGLFAVSSKIPFVINLVSQVFSQGWQLSAFENYENGNKKFYSEIFNLYSAILLLATSFIIIILKPLFQILFAQNYFESWMPVPFLLLASTFSALSGFIGVSYTAAKSTRGVFKTSAVGGVASIVLNFIFIPTFGIVGAGISSMISFFIMFYARYLGTKELISIDVAWKKMIVSLIIIFIQIFVIFENLNTQMEILITALFFIVNIILNYQQINFLTINLLKLVKNK